MRCIFFDARACLKCHFLNFFLHCVMHSRSTACTDESERIETGLMGRFPHFKIISEGEEPDEEVEVSCNNTTHPLLPVTRLDSFMMTGGAFLCACCMLAYMSSDPFRQVMEVMCTLGYSGLPLCCEVLVHTIINLIV